MAGWYGIVDCAMAIVTENKQGKKKIQLKKNIKVSHVFKKFIKLIFRHL